MYDGNGGLLEKDSTRNVTEIGGLDFEIKNLTVVNGLDAGTYELVDVSFIVGVIAGPQGYSSPLSPYST